MNAKQKKRLEEVLFLVEIGSSIKEDADFLRSLIKQLEQAISNLTATIEKELGHE